MSETVVKHKFNKEQEVWYLSYGSAKEEVCPKCGGNSSTTVNDVKYTCPKCDGEGAIHICRKEVFKGEIKEIIINLWDDKVLIKYSTGGFGNWFENDGENLYPTKQAAEKALEEMNGGIYR